MKTILNTIKKALTPTYKVVYAPEKSVNPQPIQEYKVLGNPANAGWKSRAGNRLFTLEVVGHGPHSFRADRVLSVGFAIV